MSFVNETGAKLPEGVKPAEVRTWARRLADTIETKKRSALAVTFVVLTSGTAATVLIAVRDKGTTIFTSSNVVLIHARVARALKRPLALKPLKRARGMTVEAWRNVLARACEEIGVKAKVLDRIDCFARREDAPADPPSRAVSPADGTVQSASCPDPPHADAEADSRQNGEESQGVSLGRPAARRGQPTGYRKHQRPHRPQFVYGKRLT